MASNRRMIDIEKEINDFFASEEFKKLALAYDGVCRDYCNENKIDIFDDTVMDSIYRAVNVKIKEFIDNEAICMFIKGNGIYIESDSPVRRKRDICIGHLIITECGFGGRKDNWIFRFDNEYAYYTFQVHDGEVIRHYRILDVKEKISDV